MQTVPVAHAQAQEAQLRDLLSPAGFVWELTMLRNPAGTSRYCPEVFPALPAFRAVTRQLWAAS